MIRISGKKLWRRKIILGLIAGCSAAALAADAITGVARNQTRGRLAAGDEVILLRLDQGMQEEARTKTDSQGLFTLKVQYPDKLHLVRVVHQGINYDQRASTGDAVSIDVFDAAAKVHGITGTIEIVRTGTNGNLLHVSDMVEIQNESSPPLTQAAERTFEVYLPARAKLDSVLAASAEKIGVMISAAPVRGEPGHYTVNFPLRPGSTKFAFNYDIPYDGHATFRPRLVYPLQQLAVMIPPTMKFTSRSPAFHSLATGDNDYQVQTASPLKAGEGPEFEVSGAGPLPSINARVRSRAQPQTGALPGPVVLAPGRPGSLATSQGDLKPAPSSPGLQWWVFGTTAVLALGSCGLMVWRTRPRACSKMKTEETPAQSKQVGGSAPALLEVLKEELFQLETGRLRGSISREEYVTNKQALDETVRQAMARAATKS